MRNFVILLALLPMFVSGQDLNVKRLSSGVYQYASWAEVGSWGRVESNGLIVVDSGKALGVYTTVDEIKPYKLWL